MIFRGISKIVGIVFVVNQILTVAFAYAAQQIDVRLPHQAITLFSCVTCGLLTLWLQSDARRAFLLARAKGYVKTGGDTSQGLQVAAECPKRWLVVLHIELNPAAAGAWQSDATAPSIGLPYRRNVYTRNLFPFSKLTYPVLQYGLSHVRSFRGPRRAACYGYLATDGPADQSGCVSIR